MYLLPRVRICEPVCNTVLRRSLVRLSTWQSVAQLRTRFFSVQHPQQGRHRVAALAVEAEPAPSDAPSPASFQALGVDQRFVAGLATLKVATPAPIQAAAVPRLLEGKNCAIQSYTGSGKTIAYLLPTLSNALQRMEASTGDAKKAVQVLVIAPSQELCIQIVNVAKALLPPGAKGAVQQCIGGANITRQVEALKTHKPMVVVGTPGRLATLGRTGQLGIHQCGILVVDEVDQLMSADFSEDMQWLTDHAGKKLPSRQTVLVSATLTRSMMSKAAKWSRGAEYEYVNVGDAPAAVAATQTAAVAPAEVPAEKKPVYGWGAAGWEGPRSALTSKTEASAGGVESAELAPTLPPNLRHFMVMTTAQHKVDTLRRCIHALDVKQALVFMNFQQRLQDTMFKLQARKMEVGILHGELDKLKRAQVLASFRKGEYRALIVSDVVARGLDVPDCDAVFHLELPSSAAHYAHRAGRTGRMGAPGTVVVLAEPGERWVVDKLSKKLSMPILEASLKGGELQLGPPEATDPAPRRATDQKKPTAKTRTEESGVEGSATSSRKRRPGQDDVDREEPRASAGREDRQAASRPRRSQETDRERPGEARPGITKRRSATAQDDEEDEYDDRPRSRSQQVASPAGRPARAPGQSGDEDSPRSSTRDASSGAAGRGAAQPRKLAAATEWFDDEEPETEPAQQAPAPATTGRMSQMPPQQRKKFERILQSAKLEDDEDEDAAINAKRRDSRQVGRQAGRAAAGSAPRGGQPGSGGARGDMSALDALQAELAEIQAEKKSKRSRSKA